MNRKITKATFKSFIRKNSNRLHVKVCSRFDGMTDCVQSVADSFTPAQPDGNISNTLGISGVWLVGDSRDYFEPFEADGFSGIKVVNCCGSFVVAVPA